MGLYKLCTHKGRDRDRCDHAWWGSFRGIRVSLEKWTNREIQSKTAAAAALDELRTAIREDKFDERGQKPPVDADLTFRELAALYKERHVIANGLAIAKDFDWSIGPYITRFGDWPISSIKTSDVDDFIVDLRKPRVIGGRPDPRPLTPGRRGEMLALRFADVDLDRGLITLRAETAKSKRLRQVPIATERLRRVLKWLRLDADGDAKQDQTLLFSDETGQALPLFHQAWC